MKDAIMMEIEDIKKTGSEAIAALHDTKTRVLSDLENSGKALKMDLGVQIAQLSELIEKSREVQTALSETLARTRALLDEAVAWQTSLTDRPSEAPSAPVSGTEATPRQTSTPEPQPALRTVKRKPRTSTGKIRTDKDGSVIGSWSKL